MSSDTVEVLVYGALQERFGPRSPFQPVQRQVSVHDGSTIAEVLEKVGIAAEEVRHFFLNHEYSASSRRVKPGDRLAVFGRDMALIYRQYFRRATE